MHLKNQLLSYANYNLWANRQMLDWLHSKESRFMDVELKSSFPSINGTLTHIWFGEYIWMQRMLGLDFENIQLKAKGQDIKFISAQLLQQSQAYIPFIEQKDEHHLHVGISYFQSNLNKDETNSIANIIHHILNHSTYHRGQLVTMGRELWFDDPPKTDFIQYLREK